MPHSAALEIKLPVAPQVFFDFVGVDTSSLSSLSECPDGGLDASEAFFKRLEDDKESLSTPSDPDRNNASVYLREWGQAMMVDAYQNRTSPWFQLYRMISSVSNTPSSSSNESTSSAGPGGHAFAADAVRIGLVQVLVVEGDVEVGRD